MLTLRRYLPHHADNSTDSTNRHHDDINRHQDNDHNGKNIVVKCFWLWAAMVESRRMW